MILVTKKLTNDTIEALAYVWFLTVSTKPHGLAPRCWDRLLPGTAGTRGTRILIPYVEGSTSRYV